MTWKFAAKETQKNKKISPKGLASMYHQHTRTREKKNGYDECGV